MLFLSFLSRNSSYYSAFFSSRASTVVETDHISFAIIIHKSKKSFGNLILHISSYHHHFFTSSCCWLCRLLHSNQFCLDMNWSHEIFFIPNWGAKSISAIFSRVGRLTPSAHVSHVSHLSYLMRNQYWWPRWSTSTSRGRIWGRGRGYDRRGWIAIRRIPRGWRSDVPTSIVNWRRGHNLFRVFPKWGHRGRCGTVTSANEANLLLLLWRTSIVPWRTRRCTNKNIWTGLIRPVSDFVVFGPFSIDLWSDRRLLLLLLLRLDEAAARGRRNGWTAKDSGYQTWNIMEMRGN